MKKRILITGASGCVGHYISEALIQETQHELFLLVRNPQKLQLGSTLRPGVTVLQADLRQIADFRELLQTIHCAILTATVWGGTEEVLAVNVTKTLELVNLLHPEVCLQVLYFSTASLLNRQGDLLPAAYELGTDYIRSKYLCLQQLSKSALASRILPLFPTLVFGGDQQKPASHLSTGLPQLLKWMDLIRYLRVDGSFHFIHGRDIARVVLHLIHHPEVRQLQPLVLGNPEITVNECVADLCSYLGRSRRWQINLSPWLINLAIKLFRIQMAPWDYFCLNHRYFGYNNPVNPATLGLPSYCPTVADLLRVSGVLQQPLVERKGSDRGNTIQEKTR